MDPEPPRQTSTSRARSRPSDAADLGIASEGAAGERDHLSPREIQILQLIADGCSNADVSERLVVSVETVKTHVGHILAKLGARHRAQAVAIAMRRALIE